MTEKKRGRPRVEEPRTHVTVRIAPSQHDRLIKLAMSDGLTVSAAIRQGIETRLAWRAKLPL